MTSLIDVIFLLLLFFMLSSTFSKFGELEIASASGGAGAQTTPPVFMQLRDDGVSINGTLKETDAAIEELKRLEATGAKNLILSVRTGPTSQQLVDLMAAIRTGTKLRLSIIR